MNYDITLPERMILESLAKEDKNIASLEICTSLKKEAIHNILSELVIKNLILTHDQKYQLNKALTKEMIKELNDPENRKVENEYIIKAAFEKENKFKINKVAMTAKEERIFKGLLYNLESFIKSIDENKQSKTKDQSIIFWGEMNYGEVIHHTLNA